jgi:hypothetical protein
VSFRPRVPRLKIASTLFVAIFNGLLCGGFRASRGVGALNGPECHRAQVADRRGHAAVHGVDRVRLAVGRVGDGLR